MNVWDAYKGCEKFSECDLQLCNERDAKSAKIGMCDERVS